jgi:hypothetical protein
MKNFNLSNNNMNKNNNNKKFKKFMESLSTYKTLMKPQNKKYFDEISSLYINRQIVKKSEVMKLLNKLVSRGQGPKSAVKLIENKYRNQKSIRQQNVIKSYFVTVSIDVRTIWYNKKSPIMIDDANAAKLTNLYINKYNSNMFSLYKDPKNYYTENNEAIPYKKIVQGMNGQFIENNEYSRTYQTNNYYELQALVKDNIIKEFNMNDQYKRIDVIIFSYIS